MKRGFDRRARIADVIQKSLGIIISQEIPDERFKFVSITDVTISRDLSYAKVFVSMLKDDENEIKEILHALNAQAKSIRYSLAQAIDLRIVPELKFLYDESSAHGFYISNLIDSAIKKSKK